MLTIIDVAGEKIVDIDRSSRQFARALERGDITATSEPLVYRLVREAALKPIVPATRRRLWLARHGGSS